MLEIVQMVGVLTAVFAASMAVSYVYGRTRRKPVLLVPIAPNTRVRMVGPGGTYRCVYLGRTRERLLFGAPVQSDRYVPVRIGEAVMVQATIADSMLCFRSCVVDRQSETHQFSLAVPTRIRQVDRRSEPRTSLLDGTIVRVNGEPASICDLSAGGARILSPAPIAAGDAIRMDFPGQPEVYGWALESRDTASGSREVRLCFDEPFAGLNGLHRRRLYSNR